MPPARFNIKRITRVLHLIIFSVALAWPAPEAYSQVNGDYQTRATGNWNASNTWQVRTGGVWVNCAAGDYPGAAPGAGTVNISNNHTVTVTANVPNSVGALSINGGNQDSYLQFNAGVSLTVTGQTYLNSDSNDDEKSVLVNAGVFRTGSVNANSNGDTRDAYIRITTGTVTVDGNVTLNGTAVRTYIIFAGNGNLFVGGTVTGGSITGTAGGGTTAPTAGTVTYNNAGAQNIGTYGYFNLGISGGGNKNMQGSFSVNGTLNLNSGTFVVGSNTLTLNGPAITGTPTNMSTASSSSLVFGGSSTGISIPSSVASLNNLTVNNVNGVTLNGSLTLSGTLSLQSGPFNVGGNTLTLNGPAITGTPTNLVTTSSSSLVFGGSSTGISIPSSVANLSGLTINNSNGVSLAGSVNLANTLTMILGNIVTGGNTLTLSGNTPGSLVFTNGRIIGLFIRSIGSTGSEYLFPVGTEAIFSPLKITFANLNPGTLAVQFQPDDIGTVGLPLDDSGNEIHDRQTTGYWTLTAAGSLASTDYSVNLNFSGFSNVDSRARILKRTNGGNLALDGIHGSVSSPEISRTGMSGISTTATDLAIGRPDLRIITQPSNATGCNSSFSVTVSGRAPLTYQWQEDNGGGFTNIANGGIYSGATSNILAISGAPQSMNGYSYRCIVIDGYGYVKTTNSAALTILEAILGYKYERNITIDYTRVAGGVDLYNFPVMINLTGQTFLQTSPAGEILNANGFDIIFTDGNYNRLDHQLEYYSGINGDMIAWVRIPILSSSTNTVIKILYGNPQTITDQSVTTVWDSHYKGVWHLNDNNLEDATVYDFSGTPYNTPAYSTGTIYNSLQLNGTDEYVQVNNDPNINFAGNITVSAWVNMDTRNRDQKIASNQNNSSGGYKFGIYTNNKVEFEIRNSANTPSLNRDVAGGTVLNTGQWYYLAGISSDVLDSIKTVVNGVPERPFKKTGILGLASDNLVVGKEPFVSQYYFDGRFDELRISDKVRSDGWLRTEYNNQSSPSTFYSLDATGVITNNLTSAGICNAPFTLSFGHPSGGVYSGNPYIAGNIFTPPAAGTYSITYTYDEGCGPTSVTKDFIITGTPSAPVASNKEYCSNQITYLDAVGVNIRWYSGGSLVSTSNPFSTGQTAAGTYNYTVTQTVNGCEGPATNVTLTIYNGVTINTQPLPASVCEGDNASFTVAASGLNLTYRWQENGVNLSDGGVYGGVTTPTLILTGPAAALSGRSYRCLITTSCGSPATSSAALLTVTPVPVATFSYAGNPYCPNAANAIPSFSGGGVAGTFSSTAGLVFVSSATGEVNIAASTPGSYIVTNTIAPAGGCGEAVATSPLTILSELTWSGAISNDWNNTGNWTCGLIPNATISVHIIDVINEPVLSSGTGAVNNIIIDSGSSLTITGNTIQISGTITNNGTLTATDGTIEMNGTVPQLIGAGIFSSNIIGNLVINNSAGVSLLGPLGVTGRVTVADGDLSSGGNLTLVSSEAQTAYIDGTGTGTVTGNVIMQRYLPLKFGYKYFSSPFQDATVEEFGDDMDLASAFPLFYRNEENSRGSGWISYTDSSDILNPMEGYAVNFGASTTPWTVDVTGEVNNGPLSVTLYNHDSTYTKGFNLVGNPYPSPIRWSLPGWTKTNIDNAVYYFRASDTDEYGGAYSSYVNGISSDGFASDTIPSMQGFFVHVTDGAFPVTGTLGVSNSVRINDLTRPFLKSALSSTRFLVRATASFTGDQASADPVVVYFDDEAEPGFDSEYDALKLMNTDMMMTNLYSVLSSGKKLSVNALPGQTDTSAVVPLGLKTYIDGELSFRIKNIENLPEGAKVYFRDRLTGANINMHSGQTYKVTLSAGDYNDRFSLAFLKGTTGIQDPEASEKLFTAYSTNSVLKATVKQVEGRRGIITVFDLSGRPLFIKEVFETGYYEFETGIRKGVYIVSYITGRRSGNTKLFMGY